MCDACKHNPINHEHLHAVLAWLKAKDPAVWQKEVNDLNDGSMSPISAILLRLQNRSYLADATVYSAILQEAVRASFSSGPHYAIIDWCLRYRPNLDQMISVVERVVAKHG